LEEDTEEEVKGEKEKAACCGHPQALFPGLSQTQNRRARLTQNWFRRARRELSCLLLHDQRLTHSTNLRRPMSRPLRFAYARLAGSGEQVEEEEEERVRRQGQSPLLAL